MVCASGAGRCHTRTGVAATRSFAVYTRTGDTGTSQLFTGERRLKTDPVFEALGSTDELNAAIGVAREQAAADGTHHLVPQLEEIMSRLFDVGAAVATPLETASDRKVARTRFDGHFHAKVLESWIDELEQTLPPLTAFVLPSGGFCAANLHLARAICRRAERGINALVINGSVEAEVVIYVNRLSDYLFMAARAAAQHKGYPEVLWKKAPPPLDEEPQSHA